MATYLFISSWFDRFETDNFHFTVNNYLTNKNNENSLKFYTIYTRLT